MLRKPAIEGSNTVTEKLVAEVQPTEHPAFNEFVATIAALRCAGRLPVGHASRPTGASPRNMVEEAYEAVDAIEAARRARIMREELGDVLLAGGAASRRSPPMPASSPSTTCAAT